VDVGAFFFAGPVGLAVTKGYNFASILQGSGGRSEIRTLVSDWKVERGVALSQDVAMATNENRVALQGGLDFVNERFDDVTVALINAKGCIRAQQKIHGPFKEPVVEKPSTLKSLTGPVVRLLEKVGKLFPGGECEVFYAGSVAPPKYQPRQPDDRQHNPADQHPDRLVRGRVGKEAGDVGAEGVRCAHTEDHQHYPAGKNGE
jgi:hypothetical protein